ncbi:unnamed protein product [Linum trigynum]
MNEDRIEETSLVELKKVANDQQELDTSDLVVLGFGGGEQIEEEEERERGGSLRLWQTISSKPIDAKSGIKD